MSHCGQALYVSIMGGWRPSGVSVKDLRGSYDCHYFSTNYFPINFHYYEFEMNDKIWLYLNYFKLIGFFTVSFKLAH